MNVGDVLSWALWIGAAIGLGRLYRHQLRDERRAELDSIEDFARWRQSLREDA